MTIKVAINGYGRIGRNVLRAFYEGGKKQDIQIVALNDLGNVEHNAHLTRYDTTHGKFPGTVEVDGDYMIVNGDRIRVFAQRNPAELPWGELGVDVVLECTGVPAAVAEGFEMARKNGRYLVLGQYTDRGTTPINPHVITKKQLQVYGSWTFSERHYERYLQLLPAMAERFQLEKLVTAYPLAEANQAMSDMAEGKVMKPVLVNQ